jgi:predicted membrane-bound spermidine synthase
VNRYLYFIVFISGMTTLAMEFAIQRMLGNVFGSSNLVWAVVIGLILIFLAIGYSIGGRLADRSPHPETFFTMIACGAFWMGLLPLIANPLLWPAADAFDQLNVPILAGAFLFTLLMSGGPVILLGMTSPFAIRLAIHDPHQAGVVSGRIYALSTLGSFIGAFAPVLITIPLLGTTLTFVLFGGFLLLAALLGLWLAGAKRRLLQLAWMPLVLLVFTLLWASGPIKKTANMIYERESAYNYIQVLEVDQYRLLRLNEGQGIHSQWHPTQLDFYGPWEQFLSAPFFNKRPFGMERVKSMAIVGLAAGTLARQATEVYGPIPIDGFEIDPAIIDVGRKYFEMTEPNLNAIAEDGRTGLRRSARRYDVIGVDAYRPPYIPPHLTTREFFQTVRDHLSDDGVVVINVGRSPTDRSLIDGLVATLQTVFPSVYVMDVPNTFNSIVYATLQPTVVDNLYDNYIDLRAQPGVHPLLIRSLETLIQSLQPTPTGATAFTDDHAPIEWITNRMVLSYLFFGDMEKLK